MANTVSTLRQPVSAHPIIAMVAGCIALALAVVIGGLVRFSGGDADSLSSYFATIPRESVARPNLTGEDLYERIAPSVVTIIVNDENGEAIATGSGFFIDEALISERYPSLEGDKEYIRSRNGLRSEHGIVATSSHRRVVESSGIPTQQGYVLTNYHVIRPAVSADLVLFNGDKGKASWVIAEDEDADLALLAVIVSSRQPVIGIPISVIDPRVLTTVYAFGSPEGLQGSVSEGKVSAYREVYGGDHWLQTTAPISHGSSGGPLLLGDGTVAGVITMTRTESQNLNFAIPASKLREFVGATTFRRRDVAEGASIRWHEERAFEEMASAAEPSFGYSVRERDAIALLERARQQWFEGGLGGSLQEGIPYHEAIALSQEATKSLPDEFQYLAHYISGQSYAQLRVAVGVRQIRHMALSLNENEYDQFIAGYGDSDDGSAARRHVLLVTELRPDFSPGWVELILYYGSVNNSADELRALDSLLTLMPRCAEALAMRARCSVNLNQVDSAVRDLRAAIELSPKNGHLHSSLANALVTTGEYAEAIDAYERALALDVLSDFPRPLRMSVIQYQIGLAYKKVGNFKKAIAAFVKAKSMGMPDFLCDSQIAECKQRQQ